MRTLILAREAGLIDTVLAVLGADGFDAVGTTSDQEARVRLDAGDVGTLVIGGGVAQPVRDELGNAAASHGTTVIHGALAGRSVETYVRDELEPRVAAAETTA